MTIRPAARLTDARDPVTAYLAMYISLISDAEDDQGVPLHTRHATGYLQALYDILLGDERDRAAHATVAYPS